MKFTEEDALDRIAKRIKELKATNGQDITFLGFAEPYTGTRTTNVLLHDNTFNEDGKITCASFLNRGWSCKSFRYGKSASSNMKYSLEDIKSCAKKKVEEMNSWSNSNLTFMGIVDNGEITANHVQLIVKCNKHDEICYPRFSKFIQKDHYCCPQCRILKPSFISRGEEKCYQILCDNFGKDLIERQYRICNTDSSMCNRKYFLLDLYIPSAKIAIEYDGIAHYEYREHFYRRENYQEYVNQVNRDKAVEAYCKENGIKLLRIPYKDDNRLEEVIRTFIKEGKDITTKIQPKLLPAIIYDKDTTT